MPHTTATQPAKGTILQLSISSTYTTVAQNVSLDGPDSEVGTRDTTHLLSTAKTFAPTIPDGGTVSGTLLYDPRDTTHDALFGLIWAPAVSLWKLTFADTGQTTFAFNGILTKLTPTGIEVEANLEASFEIKVSGVITETHLES